MVRQNDRDVLVNLPYTLVCSLTYMRLQRHSVIKPAFQLRAVVSQFKGKQTTTSQLIRRKLVLIQPLLLSCVNHVVLMLNVKTRLL